MSGHRLPVAGPSPGANTGSGNVGTSGEADRPSPSSQPLHSTDNILYPAVQPTVGHLDIASVANSAVDSDSSGNSEGSSDEAIANNDNRLAETPVDEVAEPHTPPPPRHEGMAEFVAQGVRHHHRHRRQQRQNNQRDNGHPPQIQIQPVPPPQQIILDPLEEDDWPMDHLGHMLKLSLDHESRHLAKGTMALMVSGWLFLYCPSASNPVPSAVCGVSMLLLILGAMFFVIKKPDFRLRGPFPVFEVRAFQLIAIIALCFLVEYAMGVLGPSIFPISLKDTTVFNERVENISKVGLSQFWEQKDLFHRINMQFFLVGFAYLLLVNIPGIFYRIIERNLVMRQIIIFEAYAHFYPVAYMVAPFFLMNVLAAHVLPIEYKSSGLLWGMIHFVAASWIVFVIYGLINYPEIPIVRPLGLPGYVYMESVALIQVLSGMVWFQFFSLVQSTYFNTVPGALLEYLHTPGFVTGPFLYYRQISQGIPEEKWEHQYPYPYSYDFIYGIFSVVSLIRHMSLFNYMNAIRERLDAAIVELEERF